MSEQHLTAVSRTQGNNRAVKAGEVTPSHYRLDFEEVPVLVQAFRRMVRGLEWDVSEMAFSTYLCAREHGVAFTALPIFLVRGFHHGAIVVNANAGIAHPKELEGRRVGVSRGYTVTTGVWARGILRDEYGVDLDAVTWVPTGDEHVAAYQPPANVSPLAGGGNLAELVAAGDIDAAVGITADRPGVVPLIPDPDAAAYAALRSRGHYPINHLVVVKDELLAERPDVAADIFEAFAESKRRYVARLPVGIDDPTPIDDMHRHVMDITGSDPLPYGIEPNRAAIEELIGHGTSQHILTSRPVIDELFAAGTHHLEG
jgi:4,5-dihydroxyphthalate decarboxylase